MHWLFTAVATNAPLVLAAAVAACEQLWLIATDVDKPVTNGPSSPASFEKPTISMLQGNDAVETPDENPAAMQDSWLAGQPTTSSATSPVDSKTMDHSKELEAVE
jgi:hypothetical protein